MRILRSSFLLGTLALVAVLPAESGEIPSQPKKLCDSLEALSPGERMKVDVEGIYVVTMEGSIFYVPEQPICVLDVQPATWVEFAQGYAEPPGLREEVKRSGRARVRFKGTLWGHGAIPADDPADPPMVAYARRIGNLRYGHMNAFPTKLVVESAEFVRAVDKKEPSYGNWSRVRPESTVPILMGSQVPQYPDAARKVGLEGVVVAQVEVSHGAVTRTAIETGDRILAAAVLDCIATWRFADSVKESFSSTFVFELHSVRSEADKNPVLDLHLPAFARLSAARHGW